MFTSRRISVLGGDKFRDEHSVAFDGTGDRLYIQQFNVDAQYTIGGWVKMNTVTADNEQFIIGDSGTSGNTYDRIMLDAGGGNRIMQRMNATGIYYNNLSISLDTWHFFAVTRDGSGNGKGYIDNSGPSSAVQADGSTPQSAAGSYQVNFVAYVSSAVPFKGNIAELFIYDKALSDSQIKTLYNGREPYNHKEGTGSGNLIHWWRMGDGRLDHRPTGSTYEGVIGDEVNNALEADVVTDPQFSLEDVSASSTGTHWQCEANWSIDKDATDAFGNPGQAIADGAVTSVIMGGVLTTGQFYKVSYSLSGITGGSIKIMLGAGVGVTRSANGEYVEYIRPTTSTAIQIDAVSTFTGKVDYLHVQKVPFAAALEDLAVIEGDSFS
tara:strand:+ start:481 stop:1623 length:1143 start_codon:yes stop_codon:yes gene_type:complete